MLCQYKRENIFQIEKDLPEVTIREILDLRKGVSVDCELAAQEGKRFCIFHDPEAWKIPDNRIAEEFMKLFDGGKRVFVGYHFSEFSLKKKESVDIGFILCKFHGSANFEGNFERADFIGATFEGPADFRGATFQGLALFDEIVFPTRSPSALIVMERVRFERPAGVRFDGTNLSWFLFLSTDIRKLDFRNATWHSKGGRYVLGVDLDLRDTLRIEEEGKQDDSKVSYTSYDVAQAYRNVRESFELHRRYAEAGDFFIGEMETRRLRPLYEGRLKRLRNLMGRICGLEDKGAAGSTKSVLAPLLLAFYRILAFSRVHLSLLGFYKILGEYGESVLRPVIWAILVVVGFTILNSSSLLFHPEGQDLYKFWRMLQSAILRSLHMFFQMEQTVSWSCIIERLLGVLLLGLTLIALRRKLERHR